MSEKLLRATRFFARLHSFDLECPHCGTVYKVRIIAKNEKKNAAQNWDPWTGRFTCTTKGCARKYVLGILAYPIVGAGTARATPEDQVPHPRQLAGLRREGGGWWMADQDAQRYARPHTTNITTEEERPDGQEDEEDE